MNNKEGVVSVSMQTELGDESMLAILTRNLKEKLATDVLAVLGDTAATRQLIEAQGKAVEAFFSSDVKQIMAIQSLHHYGTSVAAIKEASALAKAFAHVTDQHGVFNAVVALCERATQLGVVMKLNMPTAKEEDRFGTKSFLTVSKFHSESGDTVLMHPTPNATGCVHGR